MMSIKYPVVPIAPGVPPVLRNNAAIVGAAVLLLKDSVRALLGFPPQWGIFLNGQSVLKFDSFVSIEARKEAHVSDYPLEPNSFESYNKVETPGDIRISLSKTGTDSEKGAFLDAINAAIISTNIYDIYTSWKPYKNYSPVRTSHRRTAVNGADLLIVDLYFDEIRNKATTTFSQTSILSAAPSGAIKLATGALQSAPLPPYIPQKAIVQSIDNLPGFSAPKLNFPALGFQ